METNGNRQKSFEINSQLIRKLTAWIRVSDPILRIACLGCRRTI